MSRIGIIAEFNPFHNGQKYLIDTAKKNGEVVCVISSNFVQRGDTAICDKRVRAKMALALGADLVLELPVCYSMSTAQNFALGGVSALWAAGCDTLMFGSECGDSEMLLKIAEILQSQEFKEKLSHHLGSGITFAKARQFAAEECGASAGVLEGANNNLAIEYIIAAKKLGIKMKFKTVKRVGVAHDSNNTADTFASASAIREKLIANDFDFAKKYMPQEAFELLNQDEISNIQRLDMAILSVLRTKTKAELSTIPDMSEGLENKLFSAIRVATTLQDVYTNIKSKRYTMARVRRMVLSAFLGIDNSCFLKPIPYVRVLGFNKTGESIISAVRGNCEVPLVLKVTEIKGISSDAERVFDIECKATDVYVLSYKKPTECQLEYKSNLIKMRDGL